MLAPVGAFLHHGEQAAFYGNGRAHIDLVVQDDLIARQNWR